MRLRMIIIMILLQIPFCHLLFAQGGVGIGTTLPDPSSRLEINSNSGGMLIPRMTKVQRNSIVNPATSLVIYQTDGIAGFYSNMGTSSNPAWVQLLPNPANTDLNLNNNMITNLVALSQNSDAANKGYVDNLVAGMGNKGIPTMVSLESASSMPISSAMVYCDTLTEGGHTDWVLPPFEDLFRLTPGGSVLPDARTSNNLWTATNQTISTNYGYYLSLRLSDGYWVISSSSNYVRCAR